jgi:leader peptidase (prepilin peptidase) / N-methyltransferase
VSVMDAAGWISPQEFHAFWGWWLCVVLVGLCVGSFLNVVIHRLPLMMDNETRAEVREYLDIQLPTALVAPLNLSKPDSRCPHCGHLITWYENIPVLSYLALRGRCSACHTPISARYPLIELGTAALWLAIAWRFGLTPQGVGYIGLATALMVLFWIDFDTQLLPDVLTLPLVWAGLLFQLATHTVALPLAIFGAMLGYLSLWSLFHVYRLITGKEGFGYGDFKLLAAMGAWFGVGALPGIILMSSVVGTVLMGTFMLLGKHEYSAKFAFGPFLVLAGVVAIFWNPQGLISQLFG